MCGVTSNSGRKVVRGLAGATLSSREFITLKGKGSMTVLSKSQIQSRLRFDYRIARDMEYDLMKLTAHRTMDEAKQEQNPILTKEGAGQAWFYKVEYLIPTLKGPGKAMNYTKVLVDLNHEGNYPFTEPEVTLLSRPVPWSPHFGEGVYVCYSENGSLWSSDGSTLLGHILIQIAKLLNYHEPDFGPEYGGWNRDAAS
jgi:hypothetical protein